MRHRANIPPPLSDHALEASQVGLLLLVMYVVSMTVGAAWARGTDPALRLAWQTLLIHTIEAAFVIAFVAIVPQLRRSLTFLYARPQPPLSARDVLAFLAVMIAWGFGAHRFLLVFPVLLWYPASFTVLADSSSAWAGTTYSLLWSLTSGILAPFSEELVFRGILFNLWQRRWGAARAIVFSSIAFGAVHIQYAIFATLAGAFFALVYLKYGSLWPGTLLHSLFNLVAGPFLIGRLMLQKHADSIASLGEWLPELALTIAFFPLLVVFWRRFRPSN